MSLRSVLFWFCFAVLFLLLLLLGETYLVLYIAGLFSLILVANVFSFTNKKIIVPKDIFLSWVVFLVFSIISLFFSANIPLSLHWMFRMFFASGVFFFFLFMKDKKIKVENISIGVLIIGFVLSIVSLFFLVLPQYGQLIPGLNIVFSSYGHSHLGSLLLLIFPLSWWMASKYKKVLLLQCLPFFILLMMIISFGRIAIILSVFQLIFLTLFYKEKLNINKNILRVVTWMVIIISLLFVVFTSFSIGDDCVFSSLKLQVCKPIEESFRHKYWEQAIISTKDNLLLGNGPGTFELLSKKHRHVPEAFSSYAHNEFLQKFAEIGVIGGVAFVAFMTSILIYIKPKALFSKLTFESAVFIGLLTSFIESIFDFNWSFLGIFTLTLILLSVLLNRKLVKKEKNKLYHITLSRKIIIVLLVPVILFSTMYFGAEILIASNNESFVVNTFPYFLWEYPLFMSSDDLDINQKEKVTLHYKNNPAMYKFILDDERYSEGKIGNIEKLLNLDPWQRQSQDLIGMYLKNGKYESAEKELLFTDDFYEEKRKKYGFQRESIPYSQKESWSRAFVFFANRHYAAGDPVTAGRYLVRANYYQEWSISERGVFN